MFKKLSKKVLSVLLSAILLATSFTLSGFAAYAASVTPANMQSLLTSFENKMATISSSNVLTNISPAYDAYVECCDAYDYYTHGDTSVDLDTPYNKLSTAMANIGVWKRQTVNNQTTCNSDKNWPVANCITTTMNNAKRNSNTHEFFNSDCTVYWEDGLYYYDGTNPYMPVELRGSIRYGAWAMYFVNCYITSQYEDGSLKLAGWDKSGSARWAGNNGGNKYTYSDVTANVKNDSGWSVGGTPNQTSGYHVAANSTAHFANFFTIDGQADFDNADVPTYSKRYIPYILETGMESNSTYKQGVTNTTYKREIVVGTSNDKGFYVLNYKALLDAISKTKAYDYLKNVKNYKLGRLSDICESLDAATSFDLNAYNLSNYKTGADNIKYASEGLTTNFNTPIPDNAESAGSIEETMHAFEDKLKNKKYYSNYLNAYNAYVDCKKAYDSVIYGGRTDIDLNKYAYKLYKEMLKMHEVSVEIDTVQPNFSEGDASNPLNSTNCVWTERNTDPAKGTSGGFDHYWMGIYWLNGVYIYDGTAPKIPIMCLIQPNNSIGNYKNVYIWSISLEGGGTLHLADDWHYIIDTDRIFSKVISSPKTTPSLKSTYGVTDLITSGKRTYFANYMTIDAATEFANGAFYKEITPQSINVLSSLRDVGGTTEPDHNYDYRANNDDNFIYVINYKPLKDILENPIFQETYLSNVDEYSEGGLSTLLTILNEAITASENLSQTDFSDVSNIYSASNAIQSATQKFTRYSTTKNVSQYQELRDAIDTTRTVYEAGQGVYDAELWNEFTSAVETGKNYFANVLEKGYPTTKTAMANQAKAILEAYNALTLHRDDFADIKATYKALIDTLNDGNYTYASLQNAKSKLDNIQYLSYALAEEDFTIVSSKALIEAIKEEANVLANAVRELLPAPTLSTEARDAAIETLKAYRLDPDEYCNIDTALEMLENITLTKQIEIAGKTYTGSSVDQEEYDFYIREALETVQKQKYSLYVNGEKVDEYEYGSEVEYSFGEKVDIYYAYVSNSSSNVKIDESRVPLKGEIGKYYTSDTTVRFIIKGNTYLTTKTASSEANTFKVTFVSNIKSNTIGVDYVANSVTLPNPNSIPFYSFTGYSVNGKSGYKAGDTVPISANTIVIANYEKNQNIQTYTILVENEDGSFSEREITAEYNQKISLTNDAGDAVVWTMVSLDDYDAWLNIYDDPEAAQGVEKVIAYGSTYSFYAHEDCVIVCYNQDAWEEELSLGAVDDSCDPLGAATYTSTADQILFLSTKFSIISSFVVPEDCTFVECGILFAKDTSTDLQLEKVDGDNGIYRFKSTQHTVGNQFTISLTNPTFDLDFSYISYLIYRDSDGNQHTTYSTLENARFEV